MTTIDWNSALEGVTPQQGFQPLPPATYRFRIVAGEGKTAGSGAQMVSVQIEVISGPKMGRKTFHNWVLPKDASDKGKQSMGFFLGAMQVFGLTPEWFGQSFAGQQITKDHCDFIAKTLVATNLTFKATASLQSSDPSRNNFNNFIPDDGQEPEPPKEPAQTNFTPGAPAVPGQPGAPVGGPPGLPLGGFPGSGGVGGTPINQGPAWAQAPAAAAPAPGQLQGDSWAAPGEQGYAPQQPTPQYGQPQGAPAPGQYQPPAAAQAPGMQQFSTTPQDQQYGGAPQAPAQPQQYPQPGAPAPGQQTFPGQQFQGQVNPANFPPQGQPAAAAAPAPGGFPQGQAPQMPGMPAPGAQPPQGGAPQYPGQPGQPSY